MTTTTPDKKLHIAIVMQSPDIGGAETYMHSLVKEFIKKGNRVSIATNSQKFEDLFVSCPIEFSKIPYLIDIIGSPKGLVKAIVQLPLSVKYYISLLRTYQKNGVDVILMSNFGEKMLVSFLSQFFKIPVVWIEYGRLGVAFKHNFYFPKIIYRSLKDIPRAIIVPSKNTKESLILDAGVQELKLRVIPCGTEITHKKKVATTLQVRLNNKLVIGNVSRLTREKGQQLIIQAAPEIIKKIPHAYFILVGEGPDRKYFESLIKERKLEKYFLLPGFVEDRDAYLSCMDIFVFPTIWEMEGFGVVIIEAMVRGVPVVGSNFGPVPEIIEDDKTGLLFAVGDDKDLARKIIELAENIELLRKFANNAKDKALSHYEIGAISERILEVLRSVTEFNLHS